MGGLDDLRIQGMEHCNIRNSLVRPVHARSHRAGYYHVSFLPLMLGVRVYCIFLMKIVVDAVMASITMFSKRGRLGG